MVLRNYAYARIDPSFVIVHVCFVICYRLSKIANYFLNILFSEICWLTAQYI